MPPCGEIFGWGYLRLHRTGRGVEAPLHTRPMAALSHIRNFSIVAHIDHGKSTLADRLLQVTGTISEREMQDQVLDDMDLEREKGVTIKASAVRMSYTARDGQEYEINLIDTPGHVDFSYEVSRALLSCEGALLVVDATQGIEAQTLANLYLAMENDLTIIPVLNKIDLPAAQPEKYADELAHLIGCPPSDVRRVSGKTGEGVAELLDTIAELIPAPVGDAGAPARALIFDSIYDVYRGVITYVRVIDGRIEARDRIRMMSTGTVHELLELGEVGEERGHRGEAAQRLLTWWWTSRSESSDPGRDSPSLRPGLPGSPARAPPRWPHAAPAPSVRAVPGPAVPGATDRSPAVARRPGWQRRAGRVRPR